MHWFLGTALAIALGLVHVRLAMAGPGGQLSSLLTEALRGVVLLGLAAWAASGDERVTRDAPRDR